jgi:hypothetical protein
MVSIFLPVDHLDWKEQSWMDHTTQFLNILKSCSNQYSMRLALKRHTDQQKKNSNSEINPYTEGQIIFAKVSSFKARTVTSMSGVGKGMSTCGTYPSPYANQLQVD